MNGNDIRTALFREVETPSGLRFTVRKISPSDVLLSGGDADLRALLSHPSAPPSAAANERLFAFAARVLSRAVVSVKLTLERKTTYPDDEFFFGDLPLDDAYHLLGEINKWSGFTREAAEAINPSSAAQASSSTSTPSLADTESAPGTSSEEARTHSSNTPSIAPARTRGIGESKNG